MSQTTMCLKGAQGGVIGVVMTTIFICTIFSGRMDNSSISDFHNKFDLMQKSTKRKNSELKMNGNIDKCKLKWKNSKVNKTAYETLYDGTAIYHKNYLTLPKSVKPLYPDPVIRLNPDKFLLPIPHNGPNNQLIGLREATFVAIRLNRTMVIPRFFKHFSDGSVTSRKRWYIFPGHRIDIERYCKFVSCVTIEQFQEACGRQLDAVVFLQHTTENNLKGWERYTGMRFRRKVEGYQSGKNDPEEANVDFIPDFPVPGGRKYRKFFAKEIKGLFESEARCVVYPDPLYNLLLRKPRKRKISELVKNQEDLKRLTDYQLSLSIAVALGSPEYIKNISKDFVSNKLKNRPFVSVHWRYNEEDFMRRCQHNVSNNVLKKKLCQNAMRVKPEHIAQAIGIKILDLSQKKINIGDVYIASPPSERKLVAKVAKLLFEKQGWLTFSSLDLDEFMKAKYDSCEILKLHFEDIVSTIEMEICGLGVSFLGSARSSWTTSVQLARRTSSNLGLRPGSDGDIFSMSVSAMQGMLMENENIMNRDMAQKSKKMTK
uniref:uncharacterized protein LOC120341204 n=1 Tax=Styela clava TaxID=7725 RepID=UPI00193AA7F8|nr:uncharacterized protein LOC120341204 [Styela clava]